MANPVPFPPRAFRFLPVATTGDRFGDFAPYVPAVNCRGCVAFQAVLRGGGTGVWVGEGGGFETVMEIRVEGGERVISHPDINEAGEVSFHVEEPTGAGAVRLVRGADHRRLVETGELLRRIGPLGPTINDAGAVAFRGELAGGGEAIGVATSAGVKVVADTAGRFRGFEGIPVVEPDSAVLFRATLAGGGEGIYRARGGEVQTVVETGRVFASLGRFPAVNRAGSVVFAAVRSGGGSGIFISDGEEVRLLVSDRDGFDSFRGALIDDTGRVVFFATPRGGLLGVYGGPDPVVDRLIGVGGVVVGHEVTGFALNPVSLSGAGHVAVRVELDDGRQMVLRGDPEG